MDEGTKWEQLENETTDTLYALISRLVFEEWQFNPLQTA